MLAALDAQGDVHVGAGPSGQREANVDSELARAIVAARDAWGSGLGGRSAAALREQGA